MAHTHKQGYSLDVFQVCASRKLHVPVWHVFNTDHYSEYGDAVSYSSEGFMFNMRVNGGVKFGWEQQYLPHASM